MTVEDTAPAYSFRVGAAPDAPQISTVIGSTWAKYFAYSVSASDLETYLRDIVSPSKIAEEIADPQQLFIVATPVSSLSTVLGVAQITFGTAPSCVSLPSPIELQRIYVSPDHHGSGLAKALMNEVDREIIRKGGKSVWLGVWENNPKAFSFYRKCGYEVVGDKWFQLGDSRRRDQVLQKRLA